MEIKKIRKKPVEVEAVQVPRFPGDDGSEIDVGADAKNSIGQYIDLCEEIARWCRGTSYMMTDDGEIATARGNGLQPIIKGPHIVVPTIDARAVAVAGDWIIRGTKGEFYPCKPDILEATYEEVE